jgi:glycosyltransferase involved in cell wall biosynthesis
MSELEVAARNLGVLAQCHFCGYVDGAVKYAAYNKHDVFLFPTFHPEGCPTVILEALASGCCVISTDVAALKEIIVDKVHGRIVKPNDCHDLSDKIMWTIENKALVHEMGKRNQEYAFRNFEANVLVGQIKDVYRSLLNY